MPDAVDAGRPRADATVEVDAGVPEVPACTLSLGREAVVARQDGAAVQVPDLFWTGERLGVVTFLSTFDSGAHPIVSMTHVGPDLDDAPPLRRVGEESHSWAEAAWNGDGFAICWDGDAGGPGTLRFREIEGLDGTLGPRVDFTNEDGPCLQLVYGHGRYAMTWRYQYMSRDEEFVVDTVAQVFERDGTAVGDRHTLATMAYPGWGADLVRTDDGFVVVTAADDRIRVLRLRPDGSVRDDRAIDAPGVAWATADVRDDRLGVLSLHGPRETRSLVFRLLDETLGVHAERTLADGGPSASVPRLVARPEGWVSSWALGSRPSFRSVLLSLDPDGAPLGPRQLVLDGASSSYGGPDMLSVDDSVFLAYSHVPADAPTGREVVSVQRWDCDAPARDVCAEQHAQAGDCAGDHLWGWRWTGRLCEPVVGCGSDCIGEDCGALAASLFECEAERRSGCTVGGCLPFAQPWQQLCGPTQLVANAAHRMELTFPPIGCSCTPLTCRALVNGERSLHVSVAACGEIRDDCDCPGVDRVDCWLPPLSAGTWSISIDGGMPVDVVVTETWEAPDATPLCRAVPD